MKESKSAAVKHRQRLIDSEKCCIHHHLHLCCRRTLVSKSRFLEKGKKRRTKYGCTVRVLKDQNDNWPPKSERRKRITGPLILSSQNFEFRSFYIRFLLVYFSIESYYDNCTRHFLSEREGESWKRGERRKVFSSFLLLIHKLFLGGPDRDWRLLCSVSFRFSHFGEKRSWIKRKTLSVCFHWSPL